MKRIYIERRGAIQEIQAAAALAEKIGYTMSVTPEKCFAELKLLRSYMRSAREALDNTSHLPCGYQDAACDQLDYAYRDFSDYLSAMIICRGRVPRSIQNAWQRWTGEAI